ncbi:MAG: hypothetical protein KGR26_01390 [Cyanobacteria bacterium REEB65]|nr:hypothetical protein [Cyanobacteria bacterium REEB65]
MALTGQGPRARVYQVVPHQGDTSELAEALPAALQDFGQLIGQDLRGLPAAVAASHHFAHPSFRVAHDRLLGLLHLHLPHARLAGIDRLYSLAEADEFRPRFACARTLGIAALAEKVGAFLAIDCGTTSTELVVREGSPTRTKEDPDADSLARLQDGRLLWVGALDTPLDYLLSEVAGWPVVPRRATLGAAFSVLGDVAIVPPASARRQIAQALALDGELLGDRLDQAAQEFVRAAVARIRRALCSLPEAALRRGPIALLGFGKDMLLRPALSSLAAGPILDAEDLLGVPANFGAALGLAYALQTSRDGWSRA